MINVKEGEEEKSLWISHRALEVIIEYLMKKHENLLGKKIKIKRLGKVGRMYDYEFEELA